MIRLVLVAHRRLLERDGGELLGKLLDLVLQRLQLGNVLREQKTSERAALLTLNLSPARACVST